jgi:hypothetical protein
MTGVAVRIFLRYLAGVLVARGLLNPDDGLVFASDPDLAALIEAGAGFVIGASVESWYALAKRFGWST